MSGPTEIVPRPMSLMGLIEDIEAGALVLPDFQRDFDWVESDIVSLVATVLFGWPAGSLLLMRASNDRFFNTRSFETAPSIAGREDMVVLDGQQRLTALHQVFTGVGKHVYYLQVDDSFVDDRPPGTAEELEDCIKYELRGRWDQDFGLTRQRDDFLIPFYALLSASDFFEWRDSIAAVTPEVDRMRISQRLARLYKNLLSNVHQYAFPAVVLEAGLPAEAVSRIFERINRGGLKLNQFDLLVARSYAPDWNLRDKWEEVKRESIYIESFLGKDDGLPILQVISLRDYRDVRQPKVLRIPGQRIRDEWFRAASWVDEACSMLVHFGVANPDWLPYRGFMIVLAGLLAQGAERPSDRELERWFWQRSLTLAYDTASSTKIVADYDFLSSSRPGSRATTAELDGRPIIRQQLLEATRKSDGPLWRAFISLLARRAPRDLLAADGRLSPDDVVVTSLFQRATFDGLGAPHLRVLGQILVPKAWTRVLHREGLLQAIQSESVYGGNTWLEAQFLPLGDDLPNYLTDPEALFEFRLSRMEEYFEAGLLGLSFE